MRIGRLQLLTLVLGGVLVGGMVSAGAQEETEPVQETRFARPHRGPLKGAMRAQFVLPPNDDGEIRTVRMDRGVLQSVNGRTLVIEQEDGTVVEIPVSEDTRIRRDGSEASTGDLAAGDHVHTVRERIGDEQFTTRAVRAISAERYAELEARRAEHRELREACEENPEECPHPRRGRRGFGPGGPDGASFDLGPPGLSDAPEVIA